MLVPGFSFVCYPQLSLKKAYLSPILVLIIGCFPESCFIMVTLQWSVLCFWGSVSFPPQRHDDSDEAGSGNLTRTAMALGGPLRSAGCPVIFYPGLAGYTHTHTHDSRVTQYTVIRGDRSGDR